MSLDLHKLENKLDEALSNETSETLNKFLNDKRMTNNKQQTTMKLFTEKELRDFIDRNGCIVESDLDEKQLTPIELSNDSLCVNCDESKSIHNVCMDCIIKIGKENIQLPSDKQQHEQTWIAALDFGIEKMKGLNDLESKDAFEQYYNQTYGGNK